MVMKELLKEFHSHVVFWKEKSPEQIESFFKFLEAVEKPGALTTREKELIAVALAVKAHCKWCISFHVKQALEAGAKPEEIREAAWVAVLMDGGPGLAYAQLVEEALKEYTS